MGHLMGGPTLERLTWGLVGPLTHTPGGDMKLILTALVLSSCVVAHADDNTYYDAKGKELTKVEAIRTLILDPKAKVTQCSEMELSKKATLRKK